REVDLTWREGLAALDVELARLPHRYRAVLIACCLEGRSRDEAARQLGWSAGRVKGLLERGRELLRRRLARRGFELGAALLAAAVARPAPAIPSVPGRGVGRIGAGAGRPGAPAGCRGTFRKGGPRHADSEGQGRRGHPAGGRARRRWSIRAPRRGGREPARAAGTARPGVPPRPGAPGSGSNGVGGEADLRPQG